MAGYRNPGYLPRHHAILTENSELLRTILADGIKNVAHKLNGRFVLSDHQLNIILKTAPQQPDDGVFELIKILKRSSAVHFERFIECLKDLGYLGLVQKLTERHSTSVNTIPQIETRPTPSTSSSTDTVSALGLQTVTQPSPSTSSSTYTGSALVSQTETLHGNTSTEIRVSIIGKTGVGKSALGNALLQHNIFKSQQQINSVTSECGSGQRHLQLNGVDTLLKVVDTPGLFDMGNSNKTIAKEIVKCINILSPGPHLFIMVFRIDYRLSQEDIKVLEYFKNTFGEMIDKFAVVVFTGKDQLDDRSEEDAMREHHAQLSTYSDVFKNRRFATINNKDKTEGKKKDVDRILQLLQTTIENNGGDFYKNEMYEEAKKLFETRIQDQEEDNEKALAELDKLKKERIEMAQQLGHFKQQEEEHKRREKDVSNRELELKRREDLIQRLSLPSGQSYTEQASTSAYQHVEYQESPPDAKRRKVIARREKGKMSPEDDWRIISNYMYLTENLNPLHQLLDSLIQMYVLNEDDLEKIRRAESSAGTKAMIRQFLDILRTCGRHAYPKFIICLIKSGYGEVAEQLTSDVDMDGIVKREEKQLRTEKKYLQLQKKLQQIKQESEQAIHISAKENRRIKTTLNSWRIALKTKTNILVRFKSEMRTKTKLLDQLKEERDTRNEDLQMTKVRNSILYDELDRIYEQNVIIEGIKEEFVDDDNGQDVEINKSDYSSVDIQARDGKLLVKQEPLDVHQAEDVNETDDIDRSLPTDDTPVDGITKDKVVENTGLFVKQEPQDVNETCDVTQPTDLWSTTRPDIDQTHEVSQPAGDQQDITTLLTPGHHSPNRDSCLQSTSQHQDTESGQPSTSSSLDSSHINQRKDDTTPVKTSPVYDDDKVVRPVDKYTLFNVCEHDTLDKLKSILSDKTIDINNTCDLGRTAMFYCIKSDIQPIEKLELLISYGAKLDVKDKDGNSILHVACEYGCVETVKLLLNTGRVDIESMDNDDETPILLAMRSRHQPVEKLELLISYGAKLDVKYTFGDSLLHAACMIGCVETVKRLLNTGRVDIESMNHFKETPIFNAIFSFEKPIEKVELLISYGAKLDVKDGDSNRLLHEACEYGCVEIVEWLLNTGKVDIESKGNDDETPIIWALCSTKQSIQKVKLLLDKGAQLDHSSSILHYACQYGSLDCVKYFINTKEFDIESRNDKNQTPLFDCVLTKRNNFKKKIELLMSMNVNKLVRDINNLSVLQFARQHVKKPRVQYLIKNGFTD
ncbi:uncharacterized protein LOC126816929 isoform X3 [Patella vulgata]|uniref:uncharacterized protein LOC126816929 isoform X3 n=1 Tax=Patella vulgata TaxID=6465 RepID=UPI0021803DD4|nr:uncharacterized protein LOC126816929 isoform X3 [Patella vulgata]